VHLIHGLKEGSGETGSFRNARTPDSAVTIGNVRALVHPEDWDHLREAWWHASFIARVVRCKSLDPTSLIGIGDQTTYVDMSESYTGATAAAARFRAILRTESEAAVFSLVMFRASGFQER
jgi:hypothetical protein